MGWGGGEKYSHAAWGPGLEPKWPTATNEKLNNKARQATGLRARHGTRLSARPSRASIYIYRSQTTKEVRELTTHCQSRWAGCLTPPARPTRPSGSGQRLPPTIGRCVSIRRLPWGQGDQAGRTQEAEWTGPLFQGGRARDPRRQPRRESQEPRAQASATFLAPAL